LGSFHRQRFSEDPPTDHVRPEGSWPNVVAVRSIDEEIAMELRQKPQRLNVFLSFMAQLSCSSSTLSRHIA
jgi:hypothetical protein